jgi:hypothetical protein
VRCEARAGKGRGREELVTLPTKDNPFYSKEKNKRIRFHLNG